jgi:hypothetical protein
MAHHMMKVPVLSISNLQSQFIFLVSLALVSLGGGGALAVNPELSSSQDQKPEVTKALESEDSKKTGLIGDESKPMLKEPSPPVLKAPAMISVGIVSGESRVDFESKVLPFFKSQWSNCSSCEVRNLSVYDEQGNWSAKTLVKELEASLSSVTFLLFNVNWRFKIDEDKALVEWLKKATANGVIIVGSAGYPKEGESSAPLARTLLGQVPEVIIIGEINERERLLGSSYFGPEMLTAIKPPRDYVGKGLGPSFFAAKLAQNYSRKVPHDWIAQFRNQKMKSRRIWPQVEEFFSR